MGKSYEQRQQEKWEERQEMESESADWRWRMWQDCIRRDFIKAHGLKEGLKRYAQHRQQEKEQWKAHLAWRDNKDERLQFIRQRLFEAADLSFDEMLFYMRHLRGEKVWDTPLPAAAAAHATWEHYATVGCYLGALTEWEWKQGIGGRIPYPHPPSADYAETFAAIAKQRERYIAHGIVLLPGAKRKRGRPANDHKRAQLDGRRTFVPIRHCKIHPRSEFRVRAGDCKACHDVEQYEYHSDKSDKMWREYHAEMNRAKRAKGAAKRKRAARRKVKK